MKIFYDGNINDKRTYIRVVGHLERSNAKPFWYKPKHFNIEMVELPKNLSSMIIKSASEKPVTNKLREDVRARMLEGLIELELVKCKGDKTEPFVVIIEDKRETNPLLALDLRQLFTIPARDEKLVVIVDEICDKPTNPSMF